MKLDEDLTELEKKKVEILKENNQLEQALDSVLGDMLVQQVIQQEQMRARQASQENEQNEKTGDKEKTED